MYLTPEEKQIGIENFNAAVGSKPLRRDFLVQAFKDELRSGKGLGSRYFGYGDSVAEPVRVGVIGTGDEGCVLIGAINPNFIAVKSIADIRPYNIWRAFNGDHYSDAALKYRPGLMKVFGWKTEDEARKNVKTYGDYMELIANAKADGVEAVIIALPLHLHAPAAVAAMRAGLHVLTEKLMGHSVRECKEMARTAKETDLLLATGHQRHYNILYDDAVDMIRKRLLGDLHYIRAQWHRGNLPGKDSWQQPMPRAVKPDDPLANDLDHKLRSWSNTLESLKLKKHLDVPRWEKKVAQVRAQIEDAVVDAAKFDYRDMELKDASGNTIYVRPAIEDLEACRKDASHNADLLDAVLFGARRMELIGQRMLDGMEVAELCNRARDLPPRLGAVHAADFRLVWQAFRAIRQVAHLPHFPIPFWLLPKADPFLQNLVGQGSCPGQRLSFRCKKTAYESVDWSRARRFRGPL